LVLPGYYGHATQAGAFHAHYKERVRLNMLAAQRADFKRSFCAKQSYGVEIRLALQPCRHNGWTSRSRRAWVILRVVVSNPFEQSHIREDWSNE